MTEPDDRYVYREDTFDLEQYRRQFEKNARRPRKNRWEKPLIAGLLVCAAGLILFWSITYFQEVHKNKIIYETARAIMRETPAASVAAPEITPAPTSASTAAPETPAPTAAPVLPENSEPAATPAPEQDRSKKILNKIQKLRDIFSNDDIVGYLSIEGTTIDYPVVQSNDNAFYLRRDINGESNSAGTLFMDYECDPYALSRNTVIYGHNMRNGTMFHDLRYYEDAAFRQAHPVISLVTPYEETKWEIFAAYKTGTDFYYIQVLFPNNASFGALLSEMKRKSAYDTGVDVSADDLILTLSTCAVNASGSRWVINAKRIDE